MDAWIALAARRARVAEIRPVDGLRRRADFGHAAADGQRAGGVRPGQAEPGDCSGRPCWWPPRATPSAARSSGGWAMAPSAPTSTCATASRTKLRALQWLQRFGAKACLLSWLPVVGDPLCAVAGWLKLPFWPCVAYMAIGKFARYVTMTAALLWVFPGQVHRRLRQSPASDETTRMTRRRPTTIWPRTTRGCTTSSIWRRSPGGTRPRTCRPRATRRALRRWRSWPR